MRGPGAPHLAVCWPVWRRTKPTAFRKGYEGRIGERAVEIPKDAQRRAATLHADELAELATLVVPHQRVVGTLVRESQMRLHED